MFSGGDPLKAQPWKVPVYNTSSCSKSLIDQSCLFLLYSIFLLMVS